MYRIHKKLGAYLSSLRFKSSYEKCHNSAHVSIPSTTLNKDQLYLKFCTFTKLLQIVCLINTYTIVYQNNRYDCNLWIAP